METKESTLELLSRIQVTEDTDKAFNLLTTAKCLFEPNPLVGIVEFRFQNVSRIDCLKFKGDIDVVVEIFLLNHSKVGHKVHTYKEHIKGTDAEVPLQDIYGDHIIIKKENLEDALKIKMLQVMGKDCIKQRLITTEPCRTIIKSKLSDRSHYVNTHITKDNLNDFRLGDMIYVDKQCMNSGTLEAIEHMLILQALCLRSRKKLIIDKCWIHDYFQVGPETKDSICLTMDPELLESLTFDVIMENDAELKLNASHILKLYNQHSYESLTSQKFVETLNLIMKKRLVPQEALIDKIAHNIKDNLYDFKNTYGIYYKGTDSPNLIGAGGFNVHFKYELIERYIRNSLINSYEDMKTIRLYVSSDEKPFVDYMKEKFGEIVLESNVPKFDINTSGIKFKAVTDIKENVLDKKIEQISSYSKEYTHEKMLMDIYMLSRCKIVLLTHGKECDFIQIFRDNVNEGIIKLNKELTKIS